MMFEFLGSEDSSDVHLLDRPVTSPRTTNSNIMASSVNFDSLEDEIESLGQLAAPPAPVTSAPVDNNGDVNMDSIEAAMEAMHEPPEPPDKSNDIDSIFGESSASEPSTTMESRNSEYLMLSESSHNSGAAKSKTEHAVASLTSAFEENVQTLMEKYTEQALKAVQTKNQLQLKLEEELDALSQEPEPQPKLELKCEAQPESCQQTTFEVKDEIKSEPVFPDFSQITNLVEPKEEFVTFTLPKQEEDMPQVHFEVDPVAIVREIINELIPFTLDPSDIVEEILDGVISDVTTNSIPTDDNTPPPLIPLPSKRIRGRIYPPTFPPPNRPGRVTNRLEFMRKKVLPAMFNHKDAWPFKTPVDAVKLNIPDYHNIVKDPMDLGTIKKRLVNRYYWNAQECQDDFKLIFYNCYLYNKPEYDIVKMCKDLEATYDNKIEAMKGFSDLEVESEKGFVVQKRKKKLPGEEAPKRKRKCYGAGYYRESMFDFEDEIPLARVNMPYHLAKKLKKPLGRPPGRPPLGRPPIERPPIAMVAKAEESSEEESDEESEDSESEEDLGMMHRSYPSHLKNYGIPGGYGQPQHIVPGQQQKLSEKKQKHLCKYCEQPFLSRTVRDMHEKHKHGGQGLPTLPPDHSSPQPVIKKVPPLKLALNKTKNQAANSLQIVPVNQEAKHPNIKKQLVRNGPHNLNMPAPAYPQHPHQTDNNIMNNSTAFYPGQPPPAQTFPTQPYSLESDMMNFVDKKHKAINKQRQKNSQSGQHYHRKQPPPKVQNTSKNSLSSIPEELLFPDTAPSFSKQQQPGAAVRSSLPSNDSLQGQLSGMSSPPLYHHQADRPSNIISPPVHKFPKLSPPDSGFHGSPDLMDPSLDSAVHSKQLGKLPAQQSPDMTKFVQNPSRIKHTDPRTQLLQQQQQQQLQHQQQMLAANNTKIQRRFSSSTQQQQQLSPQLNERLVTAAGQTVVQRKSIDSPEAALLQQRRISGGQQQQQQHVQQIATSKNGGQFVMSSRPTIVQHSNIIQQQQQLQVRPQAALQQQQQNQARIPSTVLQQQPQPIVSRVPSIVLQQQHPLPRQATTSVMQQQQLLSNSRPPPAVLQQPQPISRPVPGGPASSRPPAAVLQQVMASLPQQPVSRPATVLQTTSRPPPAVMSALAAAPPAPRPISLQSRNDQQLNARTVSNVPLKLPTQPLPQQQPQPAKPASNNMDVLAQAFKLSDLDFDFGMAEPVTTSLLPETQELRLEDLKHLQNSSIPKVVNNGADISQLLDFTNITYQDVISAADSITVYPGPSEAEQIIFSSSSSFITSSPAVQTSRPPNSVMVSSIDANSVLFSSTNSSSQDISDLINMEQFRKSRKNKELNSVEKEQNSI